jgi:hypothetical protein
MNIPRRLWRVVKGHLALARQRAVQEESREDSSQELAAEVAALERQIAQASQNAPRRLPSATSGRRDPLEPYYRELSLTPGADLSALDQAYQARVAEIHPELHPLGSPERQAIDAKKAAVDEAYERLRDAINVTETRFEKLELDS